MAHSQIQNAGQAYAGARKRGLTGPELAELRLAAFSRKRSKDTVAEDPATVQARIDAENKAYQSRASRSRH